MTVDINTPDGLRSGSNVIASTITAGPGFGDASGIAYRLRGEAVAVPLPSGRMLFAVPAPEKGGDAGAYHAGLMQRAACRKGRPTARPDPRLCGKTFRRWAREQTLAVELSPSDYPILLIFRDGTDPKSFQRVSPADFASVFGPGYALRGVTLRVTDEDITTGIEKKLGWIGGYRNKTFAGNRFGVDNSPADSLGTGSFSMELGE
ncbi:hypothetical protein K9B35_00600 [Sphingomonas sp. R647]|uniref:hypothetical protein n=1 Tax=Sphingomonas sp. R647 TaxID=2875233 RepID=UPI001CD2B757|nr:hypothetical protein [Sphingomonas sp. R647]MCA1196455.1 hypothetical protein [Sphingomonas sp. R647]